jgi:PAS domain S-box-containing protein
MMDEPVRVLLVDDQVGNLEALEAVLEPSGCQLVRAQSADEALLALLDHEFAAIVLDIRMPGMDGLELAQLIRKRKRSRHVPILFLTAHLLDERDVMAGYSVGAVDYLTKPINPGVLQAKIAVFAELFRKTNALTRAIDALQGEVSQREQAEEALRVVNQQLELRVQERTTEVMHAHEVLRAGEERLRVALDAGRMGTWEVDDVARTSRIDAVECALLGLESNTRVLPLDQFFSLIHPEDREFVERTMREARATNAAGVGAFEVEYRVIRKNDGQVRWVLSRGRDVPEPSGPPSRTVGVSFDVTDRRQIEEALRDGDRRKNDFLATLAHELRNPLAPIRNAVQIMALKAPPHPDLKWARELIARQTKQLARLVDDLIDISRITRDKLELRKEPVELSTIVYEAVETSRPLIDEGGHELVVDLPEKAVVVNADLTRLAQVISNLLNNAAKYSDRGGRIELSLVRQGSDAVLKVKDTGMGIAPAMLPRVFEMFVQADLPRERMGGGLGVGLALAKRLVEMHDGTIQVHSDGEGLGSEFIVRLPLRIEPELQHGPSEDREGDGLSSTLRILVVDDNQDAVESLAMLLRIMGNDIRTARDGLEAVEAAQEFRPHVVLLDIGLPRLNGYEVAQRIRAMPGGNQIVLIALTGWGQDEDRRQSKEAGFDHHLVKPIEPVALMKLLAELSTCQASANELELPGANGARAIRPTSGLEQPTG